jgi:xanthine/CO dehydrogenase XdhC/CoxF family maturation factor
LSRAEKLFKALNDIQIEITDRAKDVLHYPIGLDLGAETPEDIAISIIAEIRAKFSNRSGGFLKYRKGPIHHKDGKDDQVFKQVYLKHFFQNRKSN